MTRSETPPSNPADRLADARKMIETKQEAINELKEKLAESRRMTGAKQEIIEDLKVKLAQARELLDRKQAGLDLLKKRLESFAGDQPINTLFHNSQEGMDKFFSQEIEENTYVDFGIALRGECQKRSINPANRKVIDFGVGPGIVLQEVLDEAQPSSLVAADFSESALGHAKERFPSASIIQWDIYNRYPDQANLVLCTEVLEHLEHPERAIQNLLHATSEHGTLIITVPNGRLDRSHYHVNFWSPESWNMFIQKSVDEHERNWTIDLCTFSSKGDGIARINCAFLTSC